MGKNFEFECDECGLKSVNNNDWAEVQVKVEGTLIMKDEPNKILTRAQGVKDFCCREHLDDYFEKIGIATDADKKRKRSEA